MIFHYHLFIGEVRTIRNETTYPIHGKYRLNPISVMILVKFFLFLIVFSESNRNFVDKFFLNGNHIIQMTYFKRHIDDKLREWKTEARRKPLLIRGARQVGKSTAVRELGKQFRYFVEVNLEKQPDLHYWQNHANNSQAEVDYLKVSNGKMLPIAVKASTQGSMQSLWVFMRERKLFDGIRTSLENFGHLSYYDKQDDNAERHVNIVPLYA